MEPKIVELSGAQIMWMLARLSEDEIREALALLQELLHRYEELRPDSSVTDLPLSNRAKLSLINNGLSTVREVIENKEKLPYLRGIGEKVIKELGDYFNFGPHKKGLIICRV